MTTAEAGAMVHPLATPCARVVVVGAGHVGSTFAYALLLSGLAGEIVLIDADRKRAEGEVMDLSHAVPFTHATRIRAGDYSDCAGADVAVVTAGVAQQPGEGRLELLKRNAQVMAHIVPAICHSGFGGVLLMATNPVDILTQLAIGLAGLPVQRVIGSGTILDTARFRYLLGQHLGVDPHSVHAYIIGEHGDSEVPVWSSANVAGIPLGDYCAQRGLPHSESTFTEIFTQARDAAYEIIEHKGATYYAVAAGLLRITEAILRDQNTVLPVSSLIANTLGIEGVCLSLPTVINRGRVQGVLSLELNEREAQALRDSAAVLKARLNELQA